MPKFGGEVTRHSGGGEFGERNVPSKNAPAGEFRKPTEEIDLREKKLEKSPGAVEEMRKALEKVAGLDLKKITEFNKEGTESWSPTDFNNAVNKRIETAFRILFKAGFLKGMGRSESEKLKGLKETGATNRRVVETKERIDKGKKSLEGSLLKEIELINKSDEILGNELKGVLGLLDTEKPREK